MLKKTKLCTSLTLACGGVLLSAGGAALAQGTPPSGNQQLERVEITGSSIRRVESEGALPVQVITREDIAKSGVVNTEQLLQQISAISSQGGFSTTSGAGTALYGRATTSLRGLGDERTLILVNGRRVAAFAGGGGAAVNVNSIPVAAIERVEVLKDGASAVYGSDAVAGVVNFILARNYSGLVASVTAGVPTRSGGGGKNQGSLVGGFGDMNRDNYNVTLSATVEREKELFAKDRDFAKTGNNFPYIVAGATGQGNIEGGINPTTGVRSPGFGSSPGSGYGNPLAAANNCQAVNMFLNPTPTSKGLPYCAFDSAGFVALIPDREAVSFTANGAFKVNEALELFGDGLYSRSTVTQRIQPNPVRRSFLVTDAEFANQSVIPALLLRPNNPNYAIAANYLTANGHPELVGQTLAVTSRVFDFGLRTTEDKSTQYRFVGGARGRAFGQDYELAYSHNESKTEGSVIAGFFSQVAFARIVNSPTSDYNPFSLTQSDAFNSQLAAATYAGPTLTAKSKSDVVDGRITGELYQLPAGPLQYALGSQLRKESYVTTPSAALGTGDISGLGGATAPIDKDRKIYAGFGELSIPIVKSLEAGAAIRYDHYSDVGSKSTYKGNIRWQPFEALLARASIGTGFRAPTLNDLYTPQTTGTSEQFNDPATGQTNLQVNSTSGGNPALKPERSTQTSIGIVVSPTKSVTAGVDYFKIKIRDIITAPSAQEVVSGFRAGNPTYAGSVILAPGGNDIDSISVVTVNSGDASVSGFDFDLAYRETFGFGGVTLQYSGTYMNKFDQTSPAGVVSHKVGTIVDDAGNPVLGANTGGVVLRYKHYLSATLTNGGFAYTLAQNYYSGYETGHRQIDDAKNFVGTQATYDARIGYTGIKNLTLAIGVKNLFDKNPPIFIPVSNQFQAGYDVTQYDARSRFVYGTVSYKFF